MGTEKSIYKGNPVLIVTKEGSTYKQYLGKAKIRAVLDNIEACKEFVAEKEATAEVVKEAPF